ncbi:MAG: type I secretion system permease/ATPase [Gammaproteobacteria bacterium]|nr:MAG: type I secretion system permease/ATPase [Gammaproteobacteria bacterium]RKZ92384.1 MAG: type I secretion system permease/ATPase [Gammaproteobacteria bacterium]RKZ97426.1 MAG: type I secretion system permease/ATPase [Gammaproteobacteria bacterium]
MDEQHKIDTGLACLINLAKLHGLPADPEHLRHIHADPGKHFTEQEIIMAGRDLGLKVRGHNSHWQALNKTALPVIGQHNDGHWFIIARIDTDKVLIHDPLEQSPRALDRTLFEKSWSGRVIMMTRRASLSSLVGHFDFSWFVPAILKYKKLLLEVLVASFFLQLFALLTPLFFQVVIDKVLVHKALTTLDVLAIGLLGVSLFEVVLGGLRTYLFSHTTNRVDVVLGAKLFKHLLALPISYFEARRVGDSIARVRELENIRNFITGSALTLIIDLFFTVIFFVVMYYYSPTLTFIVLGAIPFYLILSIFITPVLRKRLDEKFNRGAENQAFLVESITGVETLKAMAVEPQMQRRWEEQLAGYVGASFRAANLGNIAGQTAGFINKVTTVFILWVGATLVMKGELSVGQLIAFNMLAGRVSGPILRLVQLWQDFQQAGLSVRRLGDILNTPTEPGYNPGRASLPSLQGAINFEGLTFRYRPDLPEVLRNINLAVKPGEIIGIVGRSGSGKSTLTKLIQRLYVPENGRILIDGIDLALIEPTWLRRQIGVVLQENYLFNRSVRDNIALSNPGIAMEAIIQASKLAGAHEFILELAEGYDTSVGERGSNLSGGQRQRIAIARALLTEPRILIFDEATSALDYESERIIQDNMQQICHNKTVFIIAHRLSAVRRCDRIIVIEKGEIIEQGNHNELLKKNGMYTRLNDFQNQQ